MQGRQKRKMIRPYTPMQFFASVAARRETAVVADLILCGEWILEE
jgi:hypothetical protein